MELRAGCVGVWRPAGQGSSNGFGEDDVADLLVVGLNGYLPSSASL